jgi:DNA helicase-2/ATP-dependent DNA helicase PcrA
LFIEETIGKQGFEVKDNKQLSFLDWQKTEAPIQKQKRDISYLSYSQLSTFMTCPLQYRYRYILRIPVPPSASLSFGETIHKVMYEFYTLKHPTKQDLLRLLEKHWLRVGYGDKTYEEKMKRHGRELLSGFFEKGYDPKVVPTSLEEPFKLKITPALTLGGKIDRIDTLKDGTIEIIDYKTGTAPKARDPKKDLQLTVYAMAGNAKKVIVSFYFFEDQTKVSATRTGEQLSEARTEIAKRADEISRSDFRPTPGKYCDFCEFRLICEAWS